MNQKCKKAMVIIGDKQKIEYDDIDVYVFPVDITEWELANEINDLADFYQIVVWPKWYPPHIREKKVIEWMSGL